MIDFDQDIAPLRQQYFPEDARAFEQAMAFRQQQLMPMQMQTLKILDNQQRRETAALNYQAAQLSLDEKKKEIENRQMYRGLEPEIAARIDSIFEDPSKSAADKGDELFALQREYVGAATNSPLIQTLFTASGNHLRRKTSEAAAKAAAEKASTSSMRNSTANTYFNLATSVGEYEPAIYAGIKDGSLPDEAAATIINTFTKDKQRRQEESSSREDIEKWYTETDELVAKVTFKNKPLGSKELSEWIDRQPAGTTIDQAPVGPLVFAKPKDRKILYDRLKRLKPDLSEDDDSMSDMNLRDALLDALKELDDKAGINPDVSITPPVSEESSNIESLTGTR